MSKIAIIYHSTYGHTKLQAEAVFRGAQSVPSISAQLYTAEEAAARLDVADGTASQADLARRFNVSQSTISRLAP
jgi:hypothetical protein